MGGAALPEAAPPAVEDEVVEVLGGRGLLLGEDLVEWAIFPLRDDTAAATEPGKGFSPVVLDDRDPQRDLFLAAALSLSELSLRPRIM